LAPPTADPDAPTPANENTDHQDLTATTFREAMSRVATAVHVVTTDGAGGRMGATVSAFCSVSDEPPTVLVCLNRTSRLHGALLKNRVFCVNTLSEGHENVSDAFAGRGQLDMEERFARTTWTPLATGSPGLDDARLSVDCEVFSVSEVGTHSVIIGSVRDVRMREPGKSLIYIQRGYQSLPK